MRKQQSRPYKKGILPEVAVENYLMMYYNKPGMQETGKKIQNYGRYCQMVKAIVGANWGDEGKGKITDVLAKESDIIVRFQGGANAGLSLIHI